MIAPFLQLYGAHLVADFLLQPQRIARNKQHLKPLGVHGAIHIVVALVAVNVNLTVDVVEVILMLAIVHCGIDYLKARFSDNGWIAFSLDQSAHLAAVAAAAAWISALSS